MWDIVKTLLEQPAVITMLATVCAMVVIFLSKKKPWIETMMPLVVRIYNEIEKAMEDKTGNEKLEAFMAKFIEAYEARTDKVLAPADKEIVKDAVSVVALKAKTNRS